MNSIRAQIRKLINVIARLTWRSRNRTTEPSQASQLREHDSDTKDTSFQADTDIPEHHSDDAQPQSGTEPVVPTTDEQEGKTSTTPTAPEEPIPDPDIKDSPATKDSNRHSIELDNKEQETTDPQGENEAQDAERTKETQTKDNKLEPVSDLGYEAEVTDVTSPSHRDEQRPDTGQQDSKSSHKQERRHTKRTKQPGKHPGKRGSSPTSNRPDPKLRFVPPPHLICHDTGDQWEILLSIPEESNVFRVLQQNEVLPITNSNCRLGNFSDPLTLIKPGDEKEVLIIAKPNRPLIFKTSSDWTGGGRQVKYITQGHFIVIAPSQWTCQTEVSIEPEECLDPNYSAHFIYSSNQTNSDQPVFDNCEELYKAEILRLIGPTISDASQKGNLYVKQPPELMVSNDITWVRVGLEGKTATWGENYEPHKESLAKVLDGREGYFFIRVYDLEGRLVDSDHFRYFSNLKEIRMNGTTYSPDQYILPTESDGHTPTIIELISNDGEHLHLRNKEDQKVKSKGGTITLEPNQHTNDLVTWNLMSTAGEEAEIVMAIPRVWWRLGQQEDETGLWYDTPMQITKEEFREYAKSDTRLFLRPTTIGAVQCGFNHLYDQKLSTRDGLPLSSFMDYRELQRPLSQVMAFGVSLNEGKTVTLINIMADLTPEQNQVPYAYVKRGYAYVKTAKGYPRKDDDLRQGKGFSDKELISAGLSPMDQVDLAYDKRRRTSHQFNVDKIKDWRKQCLTTKT